MITREPEARDRSTRRPRERMGLAGALSLLAIGMVVVAIFGPLVVGVIRYHVSEGAMNQIRGGDVAVFRPVWRAAPTRR